VELVSVEGETILSVAVDQGVESQCSSEQKRT